LAGSSRNPFPHQSGLVEFFAYRTGSCTLQRQIQLQTSLMLAAKRIASVTRRFPLRRPQAMFPSSTPHLLFFILLLLCNVHRVHTQQFVCVSDHQFQAGASFLDRTEDRFVRVVPTPNTPLAEESPSIPNPKTHIYIY